MRILLFVAFLSSLWARTADDGRFRQEQIKAPKVKQAYAEKWPGIKARLHEMKVDTAKLRVFIRVLKAEKQLEVWVSSSEVYQLYATYPICATSGIEGPKRREGDGQVPEGFYSINVFNPYSNYYISLGLNYPNASDRILSNHQSPGGAIMIHGNCVTIGCIPLTDDKIKEVYVLAAEARNRGQLDIPVHVFPSALTAANLDKLSQAHRGESVLLDFWKGLQPG
jgi:murein L,D-transpeptidase YafK